MLRCAHRFPMLALAYLTRFAKTFLENSSIVTMPYDNFLRFYFQRTKYLVFNFLIYSSGIESIKRQFSERRSTKIRVNLLLYKAKENFSYKITTHAVIRWVFLN